jgi:hypothetical protein
MFPGQIVKYLMFLYHSFWEPSLCFVLLAILKPASLQPQRNRTVLFILLEVAFKASFPYPNSIFLNILSDCTKFLVCSVKPYIVRGIFKEVCSEKYRDKCTGPCVQCLKAKLPPNKYTECNCRRGRSVCICGS